MYMYNAMYMQVSLFLRQVVYWFAEDLQPTRLSCLGSSAGEALV